MEEKIYNLENAPKIGVFKSIDIGFRELFNNFIPFSKHLYPVIGFIISATLFIAAFLIKKEIITNILIILGAITVIFSLWHYFLNIVAVSYLAKDIYENKPVQSLKKYIGYVMEHKKSYVKFWLWVVLMHIILHIIFYAGIILHILAVLIFDRHSIHNGAMAVIFLPYFLIYSILIIPIYIITLISPITWAYEDKVRPLKSLILTIKMCYKKLPQTLLFTFFGITTLLISYFISWAVLAMLLGNNYDNDIICSWAWILIVGASGFFSLALYFVYTRYHFEFKTFKNKSQKIRK